MKLRTSGRFEWPSYCLIQHKQQIYVVNYQFMGSQIFNYIHSDLNMEKYQKIIDGLLHNFTQQSFQELLVELKNHQSAIYSQQNNSSSSKNSLTHFLRTNILNYASLCKTSSNQFIDWFRYFNQLLIMLYQTKSKLLSVVYRCLPAMAIKLIQINTLQIKGLNDCFLTIYNNEYKSYNDSLLQKAESSADSSLRNLYQTHMFREMTDFKYENLQPLEEINNSSRNHIKNLVFYLIYRQTDKYGYDSLMDFYHTIFIYCGVDQYEVISTRSSLYLLQKKSMLNVFRYPITEQQISWILLTLYELFARVKQDKFDLLSTITILHKKVSNQCQLKMSEVAMSLIQLLEDEYSSVFSS